VTSVEDGVMVQIDSETMAKLKQSLQAMKPFRIECQKSVSQLNSLLKQPTPNSNSTNHLNLNATPENNGGVITIEWTTQDKHLNKDVYSIVDGRSMNGVKSLRLTNTHDYANETKSIRWTEIYLIQIEDLESNTPIVEHHFNLNNFAEKVSEACCAALAPMLDELVHIQKEFYCKKKNLSWNVDSSDKIMNPFRVGVRCEVSKDQVGFLFGMNGSQITDEKLLSRLDNELIQILNANNEMNIVLEFVFYVQDRFNCAKL
jgi:hypothetical protein